MRLLSCDSLYKSFGGVSAVDGVTLAVTKGETVGIIGSNGAGKTTLFNILTGFEKADGGTVTLSPGRKELRTQGFSACTLARLGVGRTFQNLRLFEDMTVLENIQAAIYSLNNTGFSVDELVLFLSLTLLANTKVGELPYGARKRCELARTIAGACSVADGCRLIFLDEPAAGLNTAEAAELASLLVRLKKRYSLTLLLIEHNMTFIQFLCDRVYAMDEGRMIAAGIPKEVLTCTAVKKAIFGEE